MIDRIPIWICRQCGKVGRYDEADTHKCRRPSLLWALRFPILGLVLGIILGQVILRCAL